MARRSLRDAVNQFCSECLFDPEAPGTWRGQVFRCTAKACPLWQVRPQATMRDRASTVQETGVKGPN